MVALAVSGLPALAAAQTITALSPGGWDKTSVTIAVGFRLA